MLIVLGAALLAVGLLWVLAPGFPLGRLPGDIRVDTDITRVYIPITTCIVLSAVLSAVLWIVGRLMR
ncbi:MAG: DUF2905 domain-containing protein [Planctomycetota bacterium]|mgnify:CR=1 FL=1|nr:MAG: DUF2905 domain-containing protein [Planctomycetota bacterium]